MTINFINIIIFFKDNVEKKKGLDDKYLQKLVSTKELQP
jgi:hypothetical protein